MLHYETDVFSASNVVFCANNGVFCALFCANNGMIKDWFHLSILCVCADSLSNINYSVLLISISGNPFIFFSVTTKPTTSLIDILLSAESFEQIKPSPNHSLVRTISLHHSPVVQGLHALLCFLQLPRKADVLLVEYDTESALLIGVYSSEY
jgi:hypothetical protein